VRTRFWLRGERTSTAPCDAEHDLGSIGFTAIQHRPYTGARFENIIIRCSVHDEDTGEAVLFDTFVNTENTEAGREAALLYGDLERRQPDSNQLQAADDLRDLQLLRQRFNEWADESIRLLTLVNSSTEE